MQINSINYTLHTPPEGRGFTVLFGKADYNNYYTVKTKMGFTDQQMNDIEPELSKRLAAIESHTAQFDSDRTKLLDNEHATKMDALSEIGAFFGQQAVKSTLKDGRFYEAILKAYALSQACRKQNLDGIMIPFKTIVGEPGPLIESFCKAFKLSTARMNELMHTKLFTKITFDRNTQIDVLLNTLTTHGIDFKNLIIKDDDEHGAPSLQVRFDQLQRHEFISLANENDLQYQELF